jgi:hypothetical protein
MTKTEVKMAAEAQTGGQNTTSNAVILIAALLVFAAVLGGFGVAKYRVGAASVDWPTVDGRITDSRLDSTRSDNTTTYHPTVSYTYEVGGTRHQGSRITAISGYTSRGKADAVLARYGVGTAVKVSYDPEDPNSSVLEPGVGSDAMMILAAAAGCLALAVLILVSALRRRGGG